MPAQLIRGEALRTLRELSSDSVDAVVTDPPYSSGGATRTDRNAQPALKYSKAAVRRPDFTGDNRDARSFALWATLWLSECLRVTRPGGMVAVFTDWRQLPTMTDAVQAGGWVWRGIAVWAKAQARPIRGGFRAQAEYIVWGSRGPMRKDSETFLPGVIHAASPRSGARLHLTEKPLVLMEQVVQLAPPGGVVLDPFAGSGSTGVAALRKGRDFLGVELSDEYAEIAEQRLAATASTLRGQVPPVLETTTDARTRTEGNAPAA